MIVPDRAIELIGTIKPEAFTLFCYMVSISDEAGRTTVDYETMRQKLRVSKTTIRQAIDNLVAAGLITKTPRFKTSYEYKLITCDSTTVVLAAPLTTTTYINRVVNDIDSTTVVLMDSQTGKATKFQELSSAVVQYAMLPELTGGAPKWVDAIKKMETAGVEPEDIKSCVAWMHERNYSISGPWSLINPAIQEMSKRKRNGKYKKVVEEEVFTEEW